MARALFVMLSYSSRSRVSSAVSSAVVRMASTVPSVCSSPLVPKDTRQFLDQMFLGQSVRAMLGDKGSRLCSVFVGVFPEAVPQLTLAP
ncbi:MAG: hypothetical protein OXC93_09695 [Rhodospirillaceae bacterium]|nr:hypothetical protein [Rhodospirillaceae bacterium]